MKLLNLDNSPYASRVRIQIKHKKLPVDLVSSPIPLRTAEFAAAYPLAKLPVLELDSGETIGESTVILDYLEDIYPEPALIPDTPLARAHNGMLVRCADNHLAPALFPLFALLLGAAEGVDPQDQMALVEAELGKLERLLAARPDSAPRSLLTGDICLTTVIWYVDALAAEFGRENILAGYPAVAAWWQWVQEYPSVAITLEEMAQAHVAVMQQIRGS
ncbi:MAG: glutathione S-transferase family protein [Halieaceae bacterium]